MSKIIKDNFPCTSCAACCKRVGAIVTTGKGKEFKEGSPYYFPHKWDKHGVCEMLVDNRCTIYDTRPLICNIDAVMDFMKVDKGKWYEDNISACNAMIKEDGLDEKFLINIK